LLFFPDRSILQTQIDRIMEEIDAFDLHDPDLAAIRTRLVCFRPHIGAKILVDPNTAV